jgi:hypothetical protein
VEKEVRQTLIAQGKVRAEEYTPQQFEQRVHAVLAEVAEIATAPTPAAQRRQSPLHHFADIALRDYHIRSRVPVVGRLVEWLRTNSTSHYKEAYLDRIIEQQVYYNRVLADELGAVQEQLAHLHSQIEALAAGSRMRSKKGESR